MGGKGQRDSGAGSEKSEGQNEKESLREETKAHGERQSHKETQEQAEKPLGDGRWGGGEERGGWGNGDEEESQRLEDGGSE